MGRVLPSVPLTPGTLNFNKDLRNRIGGTHFARCRLAGAIQCVPIDKHRPRIFTEMKVFSSFSTKSCQLAAGSGGESGVGGT